MKDVKISIPAYDPERCHFFALGRNAMYASCVAMGLREGDEVLTPAFDCDSALQPFRAIGLRPVFYRSDPDTFSVSLDDLPRRLTARTRLLHVINHFGIPQPWDAIRSFATENNVPVLEDNAYSLFSSLGDRPLGVFGDAAIFSLRKNLPLVNGGMLRMNRAGSFPANMGRRAAGFSAEDAAYILKSAIKAVVPDRVRRAAGMRHMAPPPLFSDKDGFPVCADRDTMDSGFEGDRTRPISGIALGQLAHFDNADIEKIIDRKRHYYSRLVEGLAGVRGMRALWPKLPDGAAPFCLSVMVDSNRDVLLDELGKKFDVMAWPTLTRAVLDRISEFPEVISLGKRLLQLNLPSERVVEAGFGAYADGLIRDMRVLAQKVC